MTKINSASSGASGSVRASGTPQESATAKSPGSVPTVEQLATVVSQLVSYIGNDNLTEPPGSGPRSGDHDEVEGRLEDNDGECRTWVDENHVRHQTSGCVANQEFAAHSHGKSEAKKAFTRGRNTKRRRPRRKAVK